MSGNSGRTVAQAIAEYGAGARDRLRPWLQSLGAERRLSHLALLAFKHERRLELWARVQGIWRYVRVYQIVAASGGPGPKLREGDRQVPEGVYRVVALNPNSHFHLSMRLDFPNDFDRLRAREEGRGQPGSDIFIHGCTQSVGCLAIGNTAIEELFVLCHDVGYANVSVVIAPNDLRVCSAITDPRSAPPWTAELYELIRDELAAFPPQSFVAT